MSNVSTCIVRLGTVVFVVSACLVGSVRSSEAVSAVPKITVQASDAVGTVVYSTRPGATITMDAGIALPVTEAGAPSPSAVDVYLGILAPDGQSASWAGSAQAPILGPTGPAVPFLKNVIPTASVSYSLVIPDFATGQARGTYFLYGLVVLAGSDPGDPRFWVSASFSPLSVVDSALQIDTTTIGVRVVNDSPNCAWITPYWSNKLNTWHIFDPPPRPQFVKSGESHDFAYLVLFKSPLTSAIQLRIRAEVVQGPACNGGTISDVQGINWGLEPIEGIVEACAHVKYNGQFFFVTEPTRTGKNFAGCP